MRIATIVPETDQDLSTMSELHLQAIVMDACPWAAAWVFVDGGIKVFEDLIDKEIWEAQS